MKRDILEQLQTVLANFNDQLLAMISVMNNHSAQMELLLSMIAEELQQSEEEQV